jgi:hypothetical protein
LGSVFSLAISMVEPAFFGALVLVSGLPLGLGPVLLSTSRLAVDVSPVAFCAQVE